MSLTSKDLISKMDGYTNKFMEYYEIGLPTKIANKELGRAYEFADHHKVRKDKIWICSQNLEQGTLSRESIEKMRALGGIFVHLAADEEKDDLN